jgi:single-strand DNA-binding protein
MNNSITLIGHVGQNPKALSFPASDKKLVKFSLAVKEYSSSNEDRTLWVDVEAWNELGKRVLDHITKGRELAIQGRLAMTSYTKSAEGKSIEVTKPVIKLTGFHLLGKKPESKVASETKSQSQMEAAKEPRKIALA